MRQPLCLLLGAVFIHQWGCVNADPVKRDLPVRDTFLEPDGFRRLVLTVDGQFPGPTIRVKKGDQVQLNVTNELSSLEGLALHVHGMHQRGTPFMDGTMDTQCLIMPDGEPFVYDFNVADQVGTYWYHAHAGPFQRSDGLYGAFIVDDPNPPFHFDEDRVVLLSDWYHTPRSQQVAGLMQEKFQWIGDPDSLLINGRAANETCARNHTGCEHMQSLRLDPSKTYLLRFIGATSLDMVDVAIDGHNMTVVEADGAYVEPVNVSHLLINSGERFGVLLQPKEGTKKAGSFWMQVHSRFRKLVPVYGSISYEAEAKADDEYTKKDAVVPSGEPGAHPGAWSKELQDKEAQARALKSDKSKKMEDWRPLMDEVYTAQAKIGAAWSSQFHAHETMQSGGAGGLPSPNRYIQLEGTQCRTNEAGDETFYAPYKRPLIANQTQGFLRWCVNGMSMRSPGTHSPMLLEAMMDKGASATQLLERSGRKHHSVDAVQELKKGDVVEVVLMHGFALDGISEQHPWHLHGHSFWVMGMGQGEWNGEHSWRTLNFKSPPLKDTVTVYPFSWTVIRFVADNPGVWPLHCHLESHQVMGMSVFFLERHDELPDRPPSMQLCGSLTEGPTSGGKGDGNGKSANVVLANDNASAIVGPEVEVQQGPLHNRQLLRLGATFSSEQGEGGATNWLTFSLSAVGLLSAIIVTAAVFACACYRPWTIPRPPPAIRSSAIKEAKKDEDGGKETEVLSEWEAVVTGGEEKAAIGEEKGR